MADGVKFSSGMAYDANPAGHARLMYDPEPDDENVEPKCISLDDLIKKVPKSKGAFYMCNTYRGSFNINTYDFLIELSYIASIIFLDEHGVEKMYAVPYGDTPWVSTESDYSGEYFIIADLDNDTKRATLWVGDRASLQDVTFSNPILIGGFIYDPAIGSENLYGLSVCNDDVKVDGEYIYVNPIPKSLYEATFIGPTRGAMNVDSAQKLITVASGSEVLVNGKLYPVSQLSTSWRKGTYLQYDGKYIVYADITEGDPSLNHIVAAMWGSLYMPIGDAYVIGSFVFDGTSVTGINFKNDVFVNGGYIYVGGGGIPEAPDNGNTYGRKNKAWEPIVTQISGAKAYLLGFGGDNFLDIRVQDRTINLVRTNFAKFVLIDGENRRYTLNNGQPAASWPWVEGGPFQYDYIYRIYADIAGWQSSANRLALIQVGAESTYTPVGTLYVLGAFMLTSSAGVRGLVINSVTPLVDGVKWTEEP
jgi:hypothetical protein